MDQRLAVGVDQYDHHCRRLSGGLVLGQPSQTGSLHITADDEDAGFFQLSAQCGSAGYLQADGAFVAPGGQNRRLVDHVLDVCAGKGFNRCA